ncbi:ATP-binding protein [Rheinheimera sp.]|uniref:ATP-binding protein n=1 Tax=Rheinheimera sp. TaxID=1869214 RepID=UPI00307D2B89
MSIRWVLSLGIAGLFGLMAICQIGLIYWSKDRIEREILQQSQELTRVVLRATSKQFGPPAAASPPTEAQWTEQEKNIRVVTTEADPVDLHELQQKMEQQLAQVQKNGGPAEFRVLHKELRTTPLTQTLFHSSIAMILACSLVALLLALWLAHKFIAPLQQLITAFRQLAAGDLGVQLPVQGLADYRYVQQQFNLTSQQLAAAAAQAELHQAQQHLIELGEISRGLVHALRNPLHTLALSIEQLAEHQPDQQTQKLAVLAEQKVQHINRTLTALLTLSCGQIDRSQPVSLLALMQDLALEFSSSGVRFELELAPELQLTGAETELRSLLHAVVSNAVEASPPAGQVRVYAQTSATQLTLFIDDQGAGLSPDIAARLFQPHVSSKAEGAGMGLYICQRLLRRYYQGDLALHNKAEGGCCAQLWFGRGAQ